MHVEFWFDFSCPYAYLASRRVEEICAAAGAPLVLAPMLLGGVFRLTGAGEGPMATLSPPKAANNARDMLRWADRLGVSLRMPPAHPMRTVRALRTLLGLPEAQWSPAMHALYAAYWQHGEDLTSAAVIGAALARAGIPGDAIAVAAAGADGEAAKEDLRQRTDRAVGHGIFGAPAMIVHRDDGAAPILLWGQDRLHWLAAVLAGWDPDAGAPPITPAADGRAPAPALERPPVVDMWFDYSSPFAYLAATQIEALAARAGATHALRWRPMLLGALFRDLGTPDVPLFAMPDAKRAYVSREIGRWAKWWGVDFRFPSRFPMRTVAPLRLTLLAGEHAPALVARIFRAYWVEDRNIADDDVLRELCADAGVDPALVARTGEPDVKQALVDATAEARAAGVFGAPTCIVHGAGGPQLFWGQDRLELVDAALRGWSFSP
ncbi:MAG TPA: DsbA family protein [Kofleriaceae bacterium]|nr:DsbA family protein [Kofleriaceae bacterium]